MCYKFSFFRYSTGTNGNTFFEFNLWDMELEMHSDAMLQDTNSQLQSKLIIDFNG